MATGKRLMVAASVAALAAACARAPATEPEHRHRDASLASASDVVRELRAAGLSVTGAGPVEQPFFSVDGRLYTAGAERIQLFDYATADAAAADAAKISHDGSKIGHAVVSWIGPPHFYRRDAIIVLYVGSQERVLNALRAVLGAPIAGS